MLKHHLLLVMKSFCLSKKGVFISIKWIKKSLLWHFTWICAPECVLVEVIIHCLYILEVKVPWISSLVAWDYIGQMIFLELWSRYELIDFPYLFAFLKADCSYFTFMLIFFLLPRVLFSTFINFIGMLVTEVLHWKLSGIYIFMFFASMAV